MHWSLASLSRLSNRLISLPGPKPGAPGAPGELDYCWDNHRLPHGCFQQGSEGNCFEARDLDQWKTEGDPSVHSRGRPPCSAPGLSYRYPQFILRLLISIAR